MAATVSFAPDVVRPKERRAPVQIVAPVAVKPAPPKLIVRVPPPAQLRSVLPPPAPPSPPRIELPPPPPVRAANPIPVPKVTAATPPPAPVAAPPAPAPAERPVQVGVLDAPRPAPVETRPRAEVQLGVLDSAPQLTASAARPRSEVQTGAFSSTNGIAADRAPNARPNVAQVGAFGSAAPAAQRPVNGARATVAEVGFGRAASSPATAPPPAAAVRQSGFGDVRPAAPESRQVAQPPAQAPLEPLEIVAKPRPAYTEEARARKIEGEVAVEAVFLATGKVRALRVVRPLGHGLDAEALRAAEAIRFKPAKRNGVPVDQTAVVRIVFQLAY